MAQVLERFDDTTLAYRGRSRFETLARLSAKRSSRQASVLDVLLAASCPPKSLKPTVLQPIWAEEAMHRSCTMMRLLEQRAHRDGNAASNRVEQALAGDLASQFRSLDATSDHADVACSPLLRDIAADLVALFGSVCPWDDIELVTNIERLRLPAYKRRALVLATAELVMNALMHAFGERRRGRIEVSLTRFGPDRAWLQVKDDGAGFRGKKPNLGRGVAAGLADLLEADLAYFRTATTTTAEVVFPVARR